MDAVAQRIECPQRADALVEHALAALAIDVVLQVAGQRGDDFDFVRREEIGQILMPRFFQDRQVAAIHHPHAESARLRHQFAKLRMQFGGAAGDIERGNRAATQVVEHLGQRRGRHHLGPRRAGIHMAVQARLVAFVAEVDLQGVDATAANPGKVRRLYQRQRGMHRRGSMFWLLVVDPTGRGSQSLRCARGNPSGGLCYHSAKQPVRTRAASRKFAGVPISPPQPAHPIACLLRRRQKAPT